MKLLFFGGAVALVFALLSAFFSSPPENIRLDRMVELGAIAPGETLYFRWGGREVVVLHRDAEMLAAVQGDVPLKDPSSRLSTQPRALRNEYRSYDPAWFVAYAASTDLGCSLIVVPTQEAQAEAPPWSGGFRDECRGGRYDFAGRVLEGEPGLRNLEIPAYLWLEEPTPTIELPAIRLLADG
ncbi:MAG: hypothetical protein ACK4IT_02280 [Thioalkalivibrionaceae bacterium]